MDVQSRLNQIKNNPQMMQNPTVRNVFEMLQNKDSNGLRNLLNNTCATYGVNPQDYLNRFK